MDIAERIKNQKPVVHIISNNATLPFVVDAVLAAGAYGIAAVASEEVAEITTKADALLLNTGTPDSDRVKSFLISEKTALERDIPVVLDPVACGSTAFRRNFIRKILEQGQDKGLVIRANFSEMYFLATDENNFEEAGVDSVSVNGLSADLIKVFTDFSKKQNAVLAITGVKDIVISGDEVREISSGTPLLKKITGAGCMLSGILAAALASDQAYGISQVDTVSECLKWYGDCAKGAQADMKLSANMNIGIVQGTEFFRMNLISEIGGL